MIICDVNHSSKDFTSPGEIFIAELSDFIGKKIACAVFDDACDDGFYMTSAKTGNRKLFIFMKQITVDDEIVAFSFMEYKGNLEVHFLND